MHATGKHKSKKRGKSGESAAPDRDWDYNDIEEGTVGLDPRQMVKRKSAKCRKRELESMYGSQYVRPQPQGHSSLEQLTSSLPLKLDVGKPPKGKNVKKKKGKGNQESTSSQLQESETSFGIEDLQQPPATTRRPPPPRRSPSQKVKRQPSLSMNEQSLQLDQIMMQRSQSNHQSHHHHHRSNHPREHGQSLDRQNSSRPPLQRGRSQDRSRSMMVASQHSSGRPGMGGKRANSMDPSTRRGLSRDASSRRGRSLDRSTSITMNTSSAMMDPSASIRRGSRPSLGAHLDRQQSLARSRSRSKSLQRGGGRSASGSRNFSFDGNASIMSSVVSINGQKAIILQPISKEESRRLKNGRGGGYMRRFIPYREPEEKPPRSLVLIWAIVATELGFDLATTIIAFRSFLEDDTCCGNAITLGVIPIVSTVPFFMLVVAELTFLIRAIVLTMWPSMLTHDDNTELEDPETGEMRPKRSSFGRWFCGFMRWKVKILLQFLKFLVPLNPFFGCIIAWILMYQSDKQEAFIVLGMEGAALILHFVSAHLEGSLKTWKGILFSCIPMIPFAISISMVLYYLKQGGVCYLVDQNVFKFTGCEVCNVTGVLEPCPNSTNLFSGITDLGSLDEVRYKLLERSQQGTYCSAETSFCFYDYDDGQLPAVNANETAVPSEFLFEQDVTSSPIESVPTKPPDLSPETSSPDLETPATANPPPTPAPVTPTPQPVVPTETPTDPVPTEVPTEMQQPGPDPGSGSDGFNPEDTGSDGFNMNDLVG